MRQEKPIIGTVAVYANIGWRIDENGEHLTMSRCYDTLQKQEQDRERCEKAGWKICPSMGIFWTVTQDGKMRAV